MFHRDGVACDNLCTSRDQVDGEGGYEHCWEGHCPVSQVRGDGREEDVDDDHGQTTHSDDDLGRYAGDEPSGEEGVCTANDCQGQVLDADFDEAVAADGLHVDVHVPEEDA